MPLAGQMTTFYLNFDNKQVGRIKKSASKRKKTGMRRKGITKIDADYAKRKERHLKSRV